MDRIETIFKKGGHGSLYLENRRTEIIQLPQFSNTNEHRPGEGSFLFDFFRPIASFVESDKFFEVISYIYHIGVYPKGRGSSTKDLVFLTYELDYVGQSYCSFHDSINCRAELTCLVSVVDSEGGLTCTQSLTLIDDGIDRPEGDEKWIQVVSAESLQRNADVLLPDDTLTIQVDMVLKQYYPGERCTHGTDVETLRSTFEEDNDPDEPHFSSYITYEDLPLGLDSPLGELLRRESRYFERLCATPMAEKNSGFLEIPEEERGTFMSMMKILRHEHAETKSFYFFASVRSILDIYAMSHFYGIERLLDTCRCWLRLIFRNHFSCVTGEQVSAIFEVAEFYDDPILTGIVRALAGNEGETELLIGVEHEPWACDLVASSHIEQEFSFEQLAEMKKKEHVTEDGSGLTHCYI